MSTTTLALNEDVVQRLHRLSARAGEPAEAVLDRALADYESKLLAAGCQLVEPRADSEAELLDDPGRIRMSPRGARALPACVVSAGRRTPRLRWEDERTVTEQPDYPWYRVVRGSELEQGDLLLGCPCFVISPDATRVDAGLVVTRETVDAIVLTQSCDAALS